MAPASTGAPSPSDREVDGPAGAALPAPRQADLLDRGALRFQVAWGQPGLCGGKHSPAAARDALLATFVPLAGAPPLVLHDPSVSPAVLEHVRPSLELAAAQLSRRGLPPVSAPTVHVYRDVEQMLSISCVNRAAIGYYDGAVHMSGDPRHGLAAVRETIVHEYFHHALIGLGVPTPMWLHEGLAMDAAAEDWFLDPSLGLVAWLRTTHLPFASMTDAFPHTADEKFALAVYFQSDMMVQFVRDLAGPERLAVLVEAIARGQVAPADAFSWATGLSGAALERSWDDYLARRSRVDGPMQQLLEAAAGQRTTAEAPASP